MATMDADVRRVTGRATCDGLDAAYLRDDKPSEAIGADAWATVLVLALLRARLRQQQALRGDWEVRRCCANPNNWQNDI